MAAAMRKRIEVDWAEVFSSAPSSSPVRTYAFYPGSAPATRREAAAAGGFEPTPPSQGRRSSAPQRSRRGRAPASGHAAAKEHEREGEGASASAAKKSRKLDTEKEDALLHMLGEINKILQASSKSAEPLQVPKGTSPEEIFEALRGIPRLARADLLRAYSVLIRDDRRFRSLTALPKNMRKEWLLMEIGSV